MYTKERFKQIRELELYVGSLDSNCRSPVMEDSPIPPSVPYDQRVGEEDGSIEYNIKTGDITFIDRDGNSKTFKGSLESKS